MKHLKFSGILIDQQYEHGFQRAVLTFHHHRVYDPAKSEMVHLTDVPSELDIDLDFLGPYPSSGTYGSENICSQLLWICSRCANFRIQCCKVRL